MTVEQLALVFTEWKTRYDADPDGYQDCEAFKGDPPDDYGRGAGIYFAWLIGELGLNLGQTVDTSIQTGGTT